MSVLPNVDMTARGRARSTLVVAAALSLTGALALSGCGNDPDEDQPATTTDVSVDTGDTDAPTEDGGSSEAAPLTVDTLAERCDLLASVAGGLRGERPEEVQASEASEATVNGFTYRTAHCTFAYAGDTFSDPNRVNIYLDSAPDDPDGLKEYWDSLAVTEPVSGIGDAASWYSRETVDAKSMARALLGSDIISVRVTVPKELAEEPFMTKESVVVALGTVVAQH